jgi:hypothetical protein
MNAAALPQPRAVRATRHFGWGWLSGGGHWRAKASASLCGISPARGSEDRPNCPRQSISIDDLATRRGQSCPISIAAICEQGRVTCSPSWLANSTVAAKQRAVSPASPNTRPSVPWIASHPFVAVASTWTRAMVCGEGPAMVWVMGPCFADCCPDAVPRLTAKLGKLFKYLISLVSPVGLEPTTT